MYLIVKNGNRIICQNWTSYLYE